MGMTVEWEDDGIHEKLQDCPVMATQGEKYYKDALTGQQLVGHLVEAARKKELEYFAEKQVWRVRPREEAYQKMGRPPMSVIGEMGGRQ